MAYQVKLAVFEGPFDLLFHLIEKEEIDIYDIPIAKLTSGYLEYLESLKELDVEKASEFLIMASTLIDIKTRMLLPAPPLNEIDEPEEDPREELVRRLLLYKEFKKIAEVLKNKEEAENKIYTRMAEEMTIKVDGVSLLDGLSLAKLYKTFLELMESSEEEDETQELQREKVSVRERISAILHAIEEHSQVEFTHLFPRTASRHLIIVTFIGLLELIKVGYVRVSQDALFDKIIISRRIEENTELSDEEMDWLSDEDV